MPFIKIKHTNIILHVFLDILTCKNGYGYGYEWKVHRSSYQAERNDLGDREWRGKARIKINQKTEEETFRDNWWKHDIA